MKIVSGMQGTRNQEISSENKDGKKKKPPKEKRHTHKKKTRRIGEENKGKKQGKESTTAPVKHLGKWL